jgi:Phycobilisome protein
VALSEAVQQLIVKSRIMGFDDWRSTYPEAAIAIFQAADDNHLYLTDEELDRLALLLPNRQNGLAAAQLLRNQAAQIVDEARGEVLLRFPSILSPGGGLYPPERANACWRDFWQFLRCISYGIAAGQGSYTSEAGLGYMRQLYQELNVPLEAMVVGLAGVKTASLARLGAPSAEFAPYFDHLIQRLDSFRSVL